MLEFIFDKNFKAERRFLNKVELKDSAHNKRTCGTEDKLKAIQAAYPGIPGDYLMYLKNIEWGDFRECSFGIYTGPVMLDSLGLKEAYPLKENVIFFGDNFSGDMAGFNIDNNYSVIELWHASGELYETGLSFRQFIRKKMGMGLFGKDLF